VSLNYLCLRSDILQDVDADAVQALLQSAFLQDTMAAIAANDAVLLDLTMTAIVAKFAVLLYLTMATVAANCAALLEMTMAAIAADLAVLLDMTMTAALADLALVSAHAMLTVSVAANIAMVLPLAMRTWKANSTVGVRAVSMWTWLRKWKLH